MTTASIARVSSARALAARVLLRVEQEGSFAAAALSSALDSDKNVTPQDRALATELVYGVLRVRLGLLAELEHLLHRGSAAKLDALARTHLLLGLYQFLFLDRVPAFAATSEAVKLVTEARGARLGGFVNALLRRALRELEAKKPQALARIAWASMPEWLRQALTRSLGKAAARAFCTDALQIPPSSVAVLDPRQRDAWIEAQRPLLPSATLQPSEWSRHGVVITGSAKLAELPGLGRSFYVQEEGSQALALALGVRPGERVLDVCAGRGQKTSLLAQALGPTGELVATDLHEAKLHELAQRFEALGLSEPVRAAVDWSRGPGSVSGSFDAILVDAPCTGIGTLRRRPDLLLRREPADLERLPELQRAILGNAARLLAPGGRLLYAVCSVLDEEGPQVVDALVAAEPSLQYTHCARLLPSQHGTDGYFFAVVVKSRQNLRAAPATLVTEDALR